LRQELLRGPHDKKWVKAAWKALRRHYGADLIPWIQSQAEDLSHRPEVAWILAWSGASGKDPRIEKSLREGTPAVRAAALRILARQRGAAFLPQLRRCLREGKPRKVAQEAFRQMRRLREAALPVARDMLTSDHWTERKAAICLLHRWGELTQEEKIRAEQNQYRMAVT